MQFIDGLVVTAFREDTSYGCGVCAGIPVTKYRVAYRRTQGCIRKFRSVDVRRG
jgi:hypothetical protein